MAACSHQAQAAVQPIILMLVQQFSSLPRSALGRAVECGALHLPLMDANDRPIVPLLCSGACGGVRHP